MRIVAQQQFFCISFLLGVTCLVSCVSVACHVSLTAITKAMDPPPAMLTPQYVKQDAAADLT